MKRWLLNSALVVVWMGFVFFSCGDENTHGKSSVKSSDTLAKSSSAKGNPVSSQQSNTISTGRDTATPRKAIYNNAPDQARIDSIKAVKTKKKR